MKSFLKKLGPIAIMLILGNSNLLSAASDGHEVSGINTENNDLAIRIQNDVYDHMNGNWIKNTQIPSDKPSWSAFVQLDEEVQPQLRGIIESIQETVVFGTEQQKIRDLYFSFMDTKTIDSLGIKPLGSIFSKVEALNDKSQLPEFIAQLNRIGVVVPVAFKVSPDERDSSRYAVHISQSGLGLPDRDYYLKEDDQKLRGIRNAYLEHIQKMLTIAGDNNANENAQRILTLETDLARAQWTKVELRNPVKGYNKLEVGQVNRLTPGFNFDVYLKSVGIDQKIDTLIVGQPDYLTGFAKTLHDFPLETWKAYFKWHILSANAPFLPSNFEQEDFAFNGVALKGIPEQAARWKRGIKIVDSGLGEALGKLYVAQYFPPEHKVRMEKLVSNLMAAYKVSIEKLDWMSPATKKEAQLKLAAIVSKIAYPNQWRNYSGLTIQKEELISNIAKVNEFKIDFEISHLGKPVDRQQWGMTPQTVNAQYDPQFNDITFPAAILRPPFFNPTADDAVNYGAIGAVIGHEISHGFDDQGSQYDEKGNLRDWWTAQDHQKFAKKTAALVKQYSSFSPLPGYYVNGELTLGENIADNSGLLIAMKAYRILLQGKPAPIIDGLTGEQRFYMGWGQIWRMKMRDEFALMLLKVDPHSPSKARVNVTVRNQPEFYKAFEVKPGDKEYLPPQERVIIW
jgi:predicted metalloendopeptidase